MDGFQELLQVEQVQGATGRWPDASSPDRVLFLAEMRDRDARRCVALVLQGMGMQLMWARGLQLRGEIEEASRIVEELFTRSADPLERAEFCLERAKIANSRARWTEAITLIGTALEIGPSLLSRLTLHQMRAVAWFETGQMMRAMEDLRKVDALSSEFPHCLAVFYSRVLEARIIGRDQGIAVAQRILDRLWQESAEGGAERALTLLRAEIDLRRISGLDHISHATATCRLAEAIGDRLYAALALIDLHCAQRAGFSTPLSHRIEAAAREFERVARLWEEIRSSSATTSLSTTAQSILAYRGDKERELPMTTWDSVRFLSLARLGRVIELEPWRSTSLESLPQIGKALEAVSQGPVDKEAFFHSVWGTQKYAPHLHDTLISSLLHRVRKKLSLPVAVQESRVCAHDTLFL